MMFPPLLMAQQAPAYDASGGWSMITWVGILIAMGLMPFVFTMITSFAKLVVVGGLLRQAMGTPQIPPTSVITGLALILTVHIMSPVILDAYATFEVEVDRQEAVLFEGRDEAIRAGNAMVVPLGVLSPLVPRAWAALRLDLERMSVSEVRLVRIAVDSAEAPLAAFLRKHTDVRNRDLFRGLLQRLGARTLPEEGGRFELVAVYAPAFLLTELTEAFQIGFLIFVPFLVIDLVVSNLLLAMGMHMLSPTTISLPLKLLLFVLIDGWSLVLRGIVLGYAG